MYGQFIRETAEKVDEKKRWKWLSRGDLKVQTEALLCAVQEQTIRTKYMKFHIDKTNESPLCSLCGKKDENVQHITSGCEKLPQKNTRDDTAMLQRKFIGISFKEPVRSQ